MGYNPPGVIGPRSNRFAIHVASPEATGAEFRTALNQGTALNNVFPAANRSIHVPFGIAEPIIVANLWWHNGSVLSGNVDIGIYDTAGTLIVHQGSTAMSGTNRLQAVDITDTPLMPGRYYMALVSDTSSAAQQFGGWGMIAAQSAATLQGLGIQQAVSNFPLATGVSISSNTGRVLPMFGLTARTFV